MWRIQAWTAVPKHVADRVTPFGVWFHGRLHSEAIIANVDVTPVRACGFRGLRHMPCGATRIALSSDNRHVVLLLDTWKLQHNCVQLLNEDGIVWTISGIHPSDETHFVPIHVDLCHKEVFVTVYHTCYAAAALHMHDGSLSRIIGGNLHGGRCTPYKVVKVVDARELWVTMFHEERVLGFRLSDGMHLWSLQLPQPSLLVFHQDLVLIRIATGLLVVRACDRAVVLNIDDGGSLSAYAMWVNTTRHVWSMQLLKHMVMSRHLSRWTTFM